MSARPLGTKPGERHPSWAIAYVLQTQKRLVNPQIRKVYNAVTIDAPPYEREMTGAEQEHLRDAARLLRGCAAALDLAADEARP